MSISFVLLYSNFTIIIFSSSLNFDYIILGGEGALLALIDFVLIILAWSYFKECTTSNIEDEDGGKSERMEDMAEVSDEKGENRV